MKLTKDLLKKILNTLGNIPYDDYDSDGIYWVVDFQREKDTITFESLCSSYHVFVSDHTMTYNEFYQRLIDKNIIDDDDK